MGAYSVRARPGQGENIDTGLIRRADEEEDTRIVLFVSILTLNLNLKMRKSSSVQYLSSPEVIIHRNDFLMHVKKNTFRSQSIDCALERKHSSEKAATLPRRSSSVARQRASLNNDPKGGSTGSGQSKTLVNKCPQTVHHSLERKKASGLTGMKARMLYSGSHSTSCLPKTALVKKHLNKEKEGRNVKDSTNQETRVTSFLSFLEQSPSEEMRKHLNQGTSGSMGLIESFETSQNISRKSEKCEVNIKSDVDEKKTKLTLPGKVKKVLQGSQTAPVTKSKIPTPSIPSYKCLPRKVKFAGSLSAPISGIKKNMPSSSVTSSDAHFLVKPASSQVGTKNVKKVYPKKVSSEYSSKVTFKVSDGLCLSDYNNLFFIILYHFQSFKEG